MRDTPPSAQASTVDSRATTACSECDELIDISAPYSRPICPVCHNRLPATTPFDPTQPLALALAALIVALPANLYPQMSFSLLGRPNEYTLVGGAWHLIDSGFWWVGGLILLSTVIAPLTLLGLMLSSLLACRLGAGYRFIARCLKWYHHATGWVMLDVYLLAVIVSLVKLKGMGQFQLSLGFYCFVIMLILTSAATVAFNAEAIWSWLEDRERARH